MIIWIASYPGSGEDLFEELLRAGFGLRVESAPPGSHTADGTRANQVDAESAQSGAPIAIFASNPQPASGKTVYLVRDPISLLTPDDASSQSSENRDYQVLLGGAGKGSWGRHVREWAPTKRPDTLVLKYEDMISNPEQALDQVGDFLGLSVNGSAVETFTRSDLFGTGQERSRTTDAERLDDFRENENLLSFLFKDQLKAMSYSAVARVNKSRALLRLESLVMRAGLGHDHARSADASTDTHINQLQNFVSQQTTELRTLSEELAQTKEQAIGLERTIKDLSRRNQVLKSENVQIHAHIAEISRAVAPRLKSILTLRPMRFVMTRRNLVKQGLLSLDAEGVPVVEQPPIEELALAEREVETTSPVNPLIRRAENTPSIYRSYEPTKPLGVAVYAYDRGENVENVLESLLLQNGLKDVHVWIDGDQGNPEKRARLDETEHRVSRFQVKAVHRNRGNFGFRKMMIVSMRKMFEMYDRVLFLEDDCFPTRHAISGFGYELDQIESEPDIMSVYGHPFLTESEANGPIGRFQGWGWATTRDKLMPLWNELLDAYLMSESEYKSFVATGLSKELLKHLDATPGRQPSDTLPKFFAWDETLGFLAGLKGLKHQRTSERLIYNFGVGASSTHFNKIEHYRKPPFNMVTIDEIWQHF